MNIRRTFLSHRLLVFSMLLWMTVGAAAESSAVLTDQKRQAIDSHVAETLEHWGIPGIAVGIVVGDELVYSKGFGVKAKGSSEPVDADTVFQIGSTTKAFLGVTQGMLIDEGELAWEDRVLDHYPEFRLYDPWVTREFRVADLLAQRSGLPGWALTNLMMYGYPQQQVIDSLRYVEPVSSFRSSFAYQNAFHLVAGRIVAERSGAESWEEVLQERIFTPLKMTSSSPFQEAVKSRSNYAVGHEMNSEGVKVYDAYPFPDSTGGAGNINSSVVDMGNWLRFHLQGGVFEGQRLLSQEVLEQTHYPRTPIDDEGFRGLVGHHSNDVLSYATGWIVHDLPYGRFIDHAGGTLGFNSYVGFDPDRGFGVVVLTNVNATGGEGPAIPIGRYLIDRLLDRPTVDYARAALEARDQEEEAVEQVSEALPPRALEAYAGEYRSPILGTVQLRVVRDGTLAFKLGPFDMPVVLYPKSGDLFTSEIGYPSYDKSQGEFLQASGEPVVFLTDSEGTVDRFEWGEVGSSDWTVFERLQP